MKDALLEPLDFNEFPVCESCLEGKTKKRSFIAKGYRAKDLLELVHSNVCGPMSISFFSGVCLKYNNTSFEFKI